jgi:uncharacterized protein
MKLELELNARNNRIRAYAPGEVTVNETVFRRSLVVTPEVVVADWPPLSPAELASAHLARLLELKPEVVLIGTGARLRFPPPAVTYPLMEAGVGFEVMGTAAACRTYNILMSDGRRVAAALFMIEVSTN